MALYKGLFRFEQVTDRFVQTGKDFRTYNAHFTSVESNPQYQPSQIVMECGENRVQSLRNLTKGAIVEVMYGLASREWNGKFYNDIRFVMLSNTGTQNAAPSAPAPAPSAPKTASAPKADDPNDDLPF